MNPTLMSAFAAQRSAELHASAAKSRRSRTARARLRITLRPRTRLAHA